jgi:hypothetical protein
MVRKSILLLLVVASSAAGQHSDTSGVCWRPRSLANCKTWVVTEAALEMPVASTSANHLLVGYPNGEGIVIDDFDARLAFTIGLMANRRERSGYGLTMSMLNGDLPGRIEARYRRWLTPDHGIDLGFGVTAGRIRGHFESEEEKTRGITASAGISGTYLGADARLDLARAADGRLIHATYVTVRTGSRAGPIVTASGFLLFLGLFALATSGGDY